MKRAERKIFNRLRKIGCPVIERPEGDGDGPFVISAEDNYDRVWASYYERGYGNTSDFGIDKEVEAIVEAEGYHTEWINPGCVGVYY